MTTFRINKHHLEINLSKLENEVDDVTITTACEFDKINLSLEEFIERIDSFSDYRWHEFSNDPVPSDKKPRLLGSYLVLNYRENNEPIEPYVAKWSGSYFFLLDDPLKREVVVTHFSRIPPPRLSLTSSSDLAYQKHLDDLKQKRLNKAQSHLQDHIPSDSFLEGRKINGKRRETVCT